MASSEATEAAETASSASSLATRLNQRCFCVTIDREELARSLDDEVDEPGFFQRLVADRPHLFSNLPVFLGQAELDEMIATIEAIEEVSRISGYQELVLTWAPDGSRFDPGPLGALMGYDFHLTADGPKLIEINTNAGGAFLNAHLARAQAACCSGVRIDRRLIDEFDVNIVAMFRTEWRRQRGEAALTTIVIVDDAPMEQYLYPEFVLAKELLVRQGVEAHIADPSELEVREGALWLRETRADLVYNRPVDFALEAPRHSALREAYAAGSVVVTPNPHHHAVLANKRNLSLLSDQDALRSLGVSDEVLGRLISIPRTRLVTSENADELWQSRKSQFFKPVAGHGSKAVYRGDKLTKGVWADIIKGGFVAQTFVSPGERVIELDGQRVSRKVDVRLYTYEARPLLVAARVYQGQATNLRTPGGGFAPVLMVEAQLSPRGETRGQ
ncbi:MAG: hypothetical protein ABIY37_05215 [Devosia sp.]